MQVEARICHVDMRYAQGDTLVALVRKGAEERFRERLGSGMPTLSGSLA